MTSIVKSVGKIDYYYWRSFIQDKRTEPMTNFIDGDLIESFLDLNIKDKTECIQDIKVWIFNFSFYNRKVKMLFIFVFIFSKYQLECGNENFQNVTVEEIVKIVEDMSRIH